MYSVCLYIEEMLLHVFFTNKFYNCTYIIHAFRVDSNDIFFPYYYVPCNHVVLMFLLFSSLFILHSIILLCCAFHFAYGITENLCRGPNYGYRGKVLAFEESGPSKIGVRFDNIIPEGTNLGGLCEDGHGFFCTGKCFPTWALFTSLSLVYVALFCGIYYSLCAADSLRLDSSAGDEYDDIDMAAINELFEVFFFNHI